MIQIPVEPQITEYLHYIAAKAGIPLSGTFELTPCCNMNCKMCYVRMSKKEQEQIAPLRTAKEWLELAEEAKKQGMVYLLLTGGEPFLRADLKEILMGLNKMGLLVSINSNGTLIDESVVEWLKEVPPSRINITLYGKSNQTYARLCDNPYGFTQATKAIRLLKEAGIEVKINCSVTPDNVDDLEGIFAFAKEEGLLVQATSYMFPPMRKNSKMIGKNERLTPKEAAYQAAKIACLSHGEERFLQLMKEKTPMALPTDLEDDCPDVLSEGEGIRCRAGKCSFWVTWNGTLLPCGMLPGGEKNNVFEQPFADAWKKIHEEILKVRLPAQCASCKLRDQCKACAAMVVTETGCFEKVPEYRCQMAKSFREASQTLEKELLEKRKC